MDGDIVRPAPRARILNTAYELFARRGVRDVGIDEIITEAGIAKATLYRHFHSKDELVLAFLIEREQRWTFGTFEAGARRRGATPREQLLAIFDVFDDWFHRDDFEACSFINVLVEMRAAHPLGRASIHHLATIRNIVQELAGAAGLRDPVEFAKSWHLLMTGSIISAAEGDRDAARRARSLAHRLIADHSPGQ